MRSASAVCGYMCAVLILNTYAKSQGGFEGNFTVTPPLSCDHWRFDSDPRSPILSIRAEKCGESDPRDLITTFPSRGQESAMAYSVLSLVVNRKSPGT